MGWRTHRLITRAHRLASERKFDEALAAAREALQIAPDDPGVRLQNALLHLDRGEPREALDLLDQGSPPRNPAWPVFLGLAHADLGNLDLAREHLGLAVKMEPENRLARGLKAAVWLRAGEPERAMRALDRAGIEASPRLIGRLLVEVERTLNRLGASEGTRLRAIGMSVPDEDKTASERVLEDGIPSADVTAVGLAAAREEEPAAGSGDEPPAGSGTEPAGTAAQPAGTGAEPAGTVAEPAARAPAEDSTSEQSLPWDPTPHRHGALDRAVGALIDPIVAQTHLRRAEKLLLTRTQDPRLDEAARRELDLERARKSVEEARKAVHRYPDLPRGFCILGLAYLNAGHPHEGLRCLQEAADRDGETPDVLYAQGCCYHEMGELGTARECLKKMLAAFAKDAAAYYTLGQIDLEEGHELDARRHFEYAAYLDFLLVRERIDRLKSVLEHR